ncbi:MAG: hypothetical protein GX341_06000 [Firmicutes bacterium]|jgi:hypothetical protein|nr:hypothetical protein [Bacillota bacterium]
MAKDIQALTGELQEKIQSLAQSNPDPKAIGAAVREFVESFVEAAESGERRRRRRRRDR